MSATDDNSAEASNGISKIIVSIDSINVPDELRLPACSDRVTRK